MDGERDLRPALCVVRSSAECLATVRAIIQAAVRSIHELRKPYCVLHQTVMPLCI